MGHLDRKGKENLGKAKPVSDRAAEWRSAFSLPAKKVADRAEILGSFGKSVTRSAMRTITRRVDSG